MSVPEKVYRVAWLNKANTQWNDWYVEYGTNVENMIFKIQERCSCFEKRPKQEDFLVTDYVLPK